MSRTARLFAGPEGLDAYRVLIPQLPGLLTPGGLALVEIGHRQAEAVTAIGTAAGLCGQAASRSGRSAAGYCFFTRKCES